jgi:hypothetical protein
MATFTQIKKRAITPQSSGKRAGGSSNIVAAGRNDVCIKNIPPTQTTADKVCTAINKACGMVWLQKVGLCILTGNYVKTA